MGVTNAAKIATEGIIAIFLITIFFTALIPSIIDMINNTPSIGMPQATILIVSLLLLFVVLGITLMIFNEITTPTPPPQYGGGY